MDGAPWLSLVGCPCIGRVQRKVDALKSKLDAQTEVLMLQLQQGTGDAAMQDQVVRRAGICLCFL